MIHVVVPTFNRVAHLSRFVDSLSHQSTHDAVTLTVVDSGSTDGTQEYLTSLDSLNSKAICKVSVVRGNPDWWWSRAINEGLNSLRNGLSDHDQVLIINDDVVLPADYIGRLIELCTRHPNSLVTSCLVDPDESLDRPFHYGVLVDPERLSFADVPQPITGEIFRGDVASGRGTTFPARVIKEGLAARERQLPHYLADYGMSLDARQLGCDIIGTAHHFLFTSRAQGNQVRKWGRVGRFVKIGSPDRLLSWWHIWRHKVLRQPLIVLGWKFIRYRLTPQFRSV
jgi:GT2 family glycosyltransferase